MSKAPNQSLQQTAAAMAVPRECWAQRAAAAAERVVQPRRRTRSRGARPAWRDVRPPTQAPHRPAAPPATGVHWHVS
jgi:hypothetical protein